jgi:hypothetical protein
MCNIVDYSIHLLVLVAALVVVVVVVVVYGCHWCPSSR